MTIDESEIEAIRQRIAEMKVEHRDLDEVIMRLEEDQAYIDQLQLRRMKKRKLFLKDMIHKMESMLIPDMPA